MIVFLLVAVIVIFLYFYLNYHYEYFIRKGIQQITPQFFLGNFGDVVLQRSNFFLHFDSLYQKFKGHMGGFYIFFKPVIMLKDPSLIRQILIKDFDYFMDREMYVNEDYEPLTAHLFSLKGDRWRTLRAKLSPTFMSGKLKQMVPIMSIIGGRLGRHLTVCVKDGDDIIEMRDMMARYTTDVITSVAFGVEIDSINDATEKFRQIGEKMVNPSVSTFLRQIIGMNFPNFMRLTKMRVTDVAIEKFLLSVLNQSMNLREKEEVVRQDFLQLLIQIRNSGQVNEDGNWTTKIVEQNLKTMTTNEMVAQVFIFFLGGFETTSSVMSFALFEIAKNQTIQKRLQAELDEVLKRHDNKLTYEALLEMKYLDQIFDEALRLYPSMPMLFRVAAKDYKVPETDITITKGTQIFIPAFSLHRDSRYFQNPLLFDPDRFAPEAKAEIRPFTYLPFGEGPRNCIGMRISQLQSKIGIATVVSKFNVELAADRSPNLQFIKTGGFLVAEGGINLRLSLRL